MTQIGRFEILSELGRGAMGVVFKARDPLIGRMIALKTITAAVAGDPRLLERFRREAKAAGALQHPNIVTIYEMGEAEGTPFIAMEYLEGESLADLIVRHAPVPLAQKLGYLVQVCRALQYAHRRGVIHRDIKPANIVVTLDGQVKVVDFGIARLTDTSKTQTGTLLGTLAYMSPQQIRGKHADARSDIWSVGIVLYELLTGRRPFYGENQAALLLSVLQEHPAPLREVLGECPYQLDAIARKALAKNEASRYQSADELLSELEPVWTDLQRNPGKQAPAQAAPASARAARSAAYDRELQPVASRAKGQLAPPAGKIQPGNSPAKNAPPSGSSPPPKTMFIPPAPIAPRAPEPAPSSPSPANAAANTDSGKPAWPRSWQRGIAFAAIGLTVLAGIVLEANRVRVRSSANAALPVASNAPEPSPNVPSAVPAAVSVETSTPDAQFNAARAGFNRAVAAKDAASLRSRIRSEFQQIAQGGGPRAKDAAAYVSSAIPAALRSMTRWPAINCGVEAPAPGTDFRSSAFVACGVLDPPKLQWVRFSWPEFPARARQAGLDNGVAMLSLTVDQRGAVVEAHSRVEPDPYGFADSAIQAASAWKTTVPRSAANPVRTQFSVDVPFNQ